MNPPRDYADYPPGTPAGDIERLVQLFKSAGKAISAAAVRRRIEQRAELSSRKKFEERFLRANPGSRVVSSSPAEVVFELPSISLISVTVPINNDTEGKPW